MKTADIPSVVGRFVDTLTPDEKWALAGKWVALEIYTPQTLPMRRIEAIGSSAAECIRGLTARGLNPKDFEFSMLTSPW